MLTIPSGEPPHSCPPVLDGAPENFTRVDMTGTFNPESLYHVRRWEDFYTTI